MTSCHLTQHFNITCQYEAGEGSVCSLLCLNVLDQNNSTCDGGHFTITNSSFMEGNDTSVICGTIRPPPPPPLPSDLTGKVIVPLFLLLGITGNSLTIIVMCSRCFRHMALSKLLIALSTSDTCFILLFPFNKGFIRHLLGVDIRALSNASCKTFFWAFRTAKMTSSWFVVLIAAERFMAIWFSIKAKSFNTKKKAYVSIAMVVITIGSYNGYWCSFADQIMSNGSCIPNTKPPGLERQAEIFLVTGLTVYSFLPATLLSALNGLIIFKIVGLRHKAVVTEYDRQRADAIKTTVMLIAISIAFIILVIPISIAHLYFFARNKNIFEEKDPSFVHFRETAQTLEQLNYSINFFLYVLCGARFRERVLIMFFCKEDTAKPKPILDDETNSSLLKEYLNRAFGRKSSSASSRSLRVGSTWSLNANQLRHVNSKASLDAGISRQDLLQGIHRARSKECFNTLHRIHRSRQESPF